MPDNNNTYVHGYATASQLMAGRSAETFGDFMLPHLRPGMKLLDVGCGPGTITLGLAGHVDPGKVVGIDIGETDIENARINAQNMGVGNATFQVADATALPFDTNEFDAVFSSAALEHIPEPTSAIAEIKRVLRPGGIIGLGAGSPSRVIAVPDRVYFHRIRDIYTAVWSSQGAHPEMGIEQIELLATAGFIDLDVTAFFEKRPPSDDYAKRITSDAFVESAERIGASTREELEALASDLNTDVELPGAATFVPWIRVTAILPT